MQKYKKMQNIEDKYKILFRVPFTPYFLIWDRFLKLFRFSVKYFCPETKSAEYRWKIF